MNNAAAAARREYKRQWAKKNPDKIKAQQERYWSKKADQTAAKQDHKAAEEQGE